MAAVWLASAAVAPAQVTPGVLFQNVRIFDGTGAALSPPSNVLVRGNTIAAISTAAIAADDAGVIDGGGRVLMPGLIDAHWHAMFAGLSPADPMANDPGYANLAAAAQATATLMRGFTTVRDLGGPVFALKRAIDEGLIVGPRIYPSGAMITTTGGHGDLRPLTDIPRAVGGPLSVLEQTGVIGVADSPHEVRTRAREQLMQGASQIKMMGSGGVSSPRTPLDMATFTTPELLAGVEMADNWNTYVTVHAYTPRTIRRAIDAGAKCIEHGHLMDDATAKLMADKGIWLSIQPFIGDEDSLPLTGQSRVNQLQVSPAPTTPTASRSSTRSARRSGPTCCSPRPGRAPGRSARAPDEVVHAGRGAEDGHGRQRGVARAVRSAQPVPRQARRRSGGRARRPAARRRQPVGEHRAHRRPQEELRRHHEGRHRLQERAGALKSQHGGHGGAGGNKRAAVVSMGDGFARRCV